MITRAKSLLIIVGKHEALSIDTNWGEIIKCCCQNKALVRGERILHERIEFSM